MAWNVDKIYNFSKELINKAQRGEYTPDAFFLFWNAEQRSYMEDLLGRFQEVKQTRNAGLIMSSPILAALQPFIKTTTQAITSGTGLYPADFRTEIALRIGGYKVVYINHNQIADVNDSNIDPPSTADNKYYYTIYNDGLHFLPNTVTTAALDYIADCLDVVWGYTVNEATELPEYNAGASTQPQWKNNELTEITKRTLTMLGVKFSSNDFANFGRSVTTTGK